MPPERTRNGKVGAALVAGGGAGGMQAALDLAAAGIKVYLADRKPAIGGVMAQLDKTFPTNDCAMCTLAPRLVEVGRNRDIEVLPLSEIEDVDGSVGNFRVTLRRRARYIDVSRCYGCGACTEVCPVRIPDPHNLGLNGTSAISRPYPQAVPSSYAVNRLGAAPCRTACPAGQKAQGYVALVHARRFEDAFHVILRENPFPSVCGRVCRAYCEEQCTRRRVDEAVAVRALKRFVADWAFERKLARRPPKPAPGRERNASKRVAVVGAGPAGLTAARDLADRGFRVTVFEALPKPGGMMWAGIPDFRLPRERLEWDVANILAAGGIELRLGHRVESVDALLRDGFAAVFLATGMHASRKLRIPGHDLPDVLVATDFLRDAAMGRDVRVKDRVVVLGGGDVAMDVARTALRRGAKQVRVACLEPRGKMPGDPREVEEAEREGALVFPSRTFLEIASENGRVTGVKCAEVTFRGFAPDGRPDIDVRPGTEHVLPADTVVFAIGQTSDLPFATEGLAVSRGGAIHADPDTLATSKRGVFAGGDVVTGTRFVVDAIAAGHRAARSIEAYVSGGYRAPAEPVPAKVELTDAEIAARIRSRSARHAEAPGGDGRWSEETAVAEAARCLQCGICSECSLCAEVCEAGAIDLLLPREQTVALDVGAVVLAPGSAPFDARSKASLGYGRFPNVVTALEFERMLSASGPSAGEILRPSDGKPPRRIAFLQCVGSREAQRDWCSSVCCMYATKQAILAKEHVSEELECDVFLMDMRAFGKQFEEFYQRARREGVRYIRCRPHAVREVPGSKSLAIEYLGEGDRKATGEYDLVVLSVGLEPPGGAAEVAEAAGVRLNEFGFCDTATFRPVETAREGVYVAGAFSGPKDIPETVVQGSAAAARVLADLADAAYTRVVRKEYPPETDVAGQAPRIGVFVCHCGRNIAGVVDVKAVVEYAKTLPDVVHAESNLYTCSNDTQDAMKERIREHGLNRVVVASCTPRTHEPLFRDTIQSGGLNPYLFEMANIRDQCAWVHKDHPKEATEKAKDLVRMAVAKSRLLEPLRKRSITVRRTALVLGGGLAGMTCANSLADQGYEVVLVEKERELGGNLRRVRRLIDGADPQRELALLVVRTQANPRIRVLTDASVEKFSGTVGDFTSTVVCRGETHEVAHGVVVVATGAREYAPTEYLQGQDPRVLTQLELEALLAGADGHEWPRATRRRPSPAVVMIQCVGSRDAERPWCSRICCTEAVKNALWIKERHPETAVYVLYRDLRVYGFKERHYSRARREGVAFLRWEEDRPPLVSRGGDALAVEVFDPTLGETIRIDADLVVLSCGITRDGADDATAKLLKVPVGAGGFLLEAHLKLRPVDFATPGVFLCGLAHAAKSVEESVAQAQAAAARAAAVLSRDHVELDANVSEVDYESCDGCGYCVDPCPAHALALFEYMSRGAVKKAVETDEAACLGCGSCQATCPKGGIRIRGFTLAQLEAQVHAALEVV